MIKLRGTCRKFLETLMRIYVNNVIAPWIEARLFAAWDEYQAGPVYRERLTCMGIKYACQTFIKDKGEQLYYLHRKMREEPNFKWRFWFAPFTIAMPDLLQTAAESGIFSEPEKKGA